MSIWNPENLTAARKAATGKAVVRVYDCGAEIISTGRICRNDFRGKIFKDANQAYSAMKKCGELLQAERSKQ